MEEFIKNLLQAVIIAAVPIITTYLCKWLAAKKDQAVAATENECAKALIGDAMSAVERAVKVINQTYVDALKKQNNFSVENQKEAFQMCYDTAVHLMTQEAADYIAEAYGSLSLWLSAQIEAQVKEQKAA